MLFNQKGLIVYTDMLGMPENCSHCKLKYDLEPGFWLGALWTSYPIVVLLELPFLICALMLDGIWMWLSFVGLILTFFIAWPLMLRLGRSFWIHVNVRYEHERN
jgi:flagellar biosynthesis protein FliP